MMSPSIALRLKMALVCLLVSVTSVADERIKPFVLASQESGSLQVIADQTRAALNTGGFRVIGEYQPYEHGMVLAFTSADLATAAAETDLGGFAAVLRAGITQVGDDIQVSYVNPAYIAKAYQLSGDLQGVSDALSEALGARETFGSRKGLTGKKLGRYRYMFGMERFDDTYALGRFDSQSEAVNTIDAALENNDRGLSQVYRLALPEQHAVLYGVAMQPADEDDRYYNDAYQMSVVDVGDLRSTAYLPYEVLVKNGEIQALHMRFRMAVHFPDLSMMGKHSFMTLMPSPKAIEKALSSLANP